MRDKVNVIYHIREGEGTIKTISDSSSTDRLSETISEMEKISFVC